ncbi:MAG: energy transducer TonB [Acidobacteriota bacterium]
MTAQVEAVAGKPPDRNGFLEERSLFDVPREKRLGGALGASALIHIGGLVLAIIVASLPAATNSTIFRPSNPDQIVWLTTPGPGGGGGGGGNRNPEPPQKLQTPGKDKISIPVEKKPDITPLDKPKDEPKPEPVLNIPAQSMASAIESLPGTIEGLPSPNGSQGPGSGGGAGTGTGTGSGPGQGSGLGPGYGAGFGGGAYRPGSGIEIPRVLREVKPQYTADAMRAKVQGVVELEAVVLPDGSVGDVQVTRSLDRTFGLDNEAIKAVKQWRFAPGTRLGQPVPVLVTIELTFTLR